MQIAPEPKPVQAVERVVNPREDAFTGFVFKIHANMDPNHRSCIAFVKVCSGKFERNVYYHHVGQNKQMRFSAPTAFMAQKKSIVDEAWPGDIVGLPDTGNFKSATLSRPVKTCISRGCRASRPRCSNTLRTPTR